MKQENSSTLRSRSFRDRGDGPVGALEAELRAPGLLERRREGHEETRVHVQVRRRGPQLHQTTFDDVLNGVSNFKARNCIIDNSKI